MPLLWIALVGQAAADDDKDEAMLEETKIQFLGPLKERDCGYSLVKTTFFCEFVLRCDGFLRLLLVVVLSLPSFRVCKAEVQSPGKSLQTKLSL